MSTRLPTSTALALSCALLAPLGDADAQPASPRDSIAAHGAAATAEAQALAGWVSEGRLRAIAVASDPLVSGRTHQRLQQLHHGIPIVGADVTVQWDGVRVVSIFGRRVSHPEVGVAPGLDATAVRSLTEREGLAVLDGAPRLVLVDDVRRPGALRLVYELDTRGPYGRRRTRVDASSGDVLSSRLPYRTQEALLPCPDCAVGVGVGVNGDRKKLSVRTRDDGFRADDGLRPVRVATYDLQGDWERALDIVTEQDTLRPEDLAADPDNQWQDGASVDGHVGAGWTLDYLTERFGRHGLDDHGGPVSVLVHPVRREDYFTVPRDVAVLFHQNAFFCLPCGPAGLLVFGEGLPPGETVGSSGQWVDFFTAGLDVVAHEIGHAVTDFSSRFIYQGESGALSEAFSDLLGVGVEFFMSETGRHPAQRATYVVGEEVLIPGGIRSLSNPRTLGDPDHYSLRFIGPDDNGGVHTNSTIVSHVYYLAVEGGTHLTSGVSVTGLGRARRALVEQVFYRAFTLLLPSDATFALARAATLQSARDLSDDPVVEQTLATAWTAVGVS